MSNFNKRFVISLLAFPIIYILLYQKIFSNILIVIVCLFCAYEWNKIFNKKNYIYLFGLFILSVFFFSIIKIIYIRIIKIIYTKGGGCRGRKRSKASLNNLGFPTLKLILFYV